MNFMPPLSIMNQKKPDLAFGSETKSIASFFIFWKIPVYGEIAVATGE
ncbi:hypothetical protein OpiT1DRAFT_02394 [Opitutaceae bacterium TAV1]|nr:hypothetical protein OpiT1DRAFT_02394 [Opitutaceae bacterium TAV1]